MQIFAFLLSFLMPIAVLVGLFLLFRAVMLWYWKIDKIVDQLERIERNTRPQKTVIASSESAPSDQTQQDQVAL